MSTILNPYIHFKDNAREAMEFYKSVFGGVLDVNTFKDLGASSGPDNDNQIMHSQLTSNGGLVLMGADTMNSEEDKQSGFSISLSGDDEAELTGFFNKLMDGGNILQPLTKATWGDTFGMGVDKFGIRWLVNIAGKKE